MFETILAPFDGSKLAERALPYVIELARAFNSEVDLLGVCESGNSEEGQACQLVMGTAAEAIKKGLTGTQGKVKTVVLSGGPAQQIIDYAEHNNVDIIVITSHGRSGVGPWSLGSTVHKMLNLKARAPILILRVAESPEDCKSGLLSSIVMPLDGSSRGEAAIPYVIELSKHLKLQITLLQVVELGKDVHAGFGGWRHIPYLDRDVAAAKTEAQKYLDGVATRFIGTKAQVKTEVREGDTAKEIMKMTDSLGHCLIAMGSHGHSGIDIWIYGSTTYKIVQGSKKSLLLVRTTPVNV